MRWPLVGQGNRAALLHLAFGGPFHQHFHPARHNRKVALLSRDDVRKIFGQPCQMCDLFFELQQSLFHLFLFPHLPLAPNPPFR